MGDVVDFRHERSRRDDLAEARAEQAERASALREALLPNRSMSAADQVLVAEGVWRVLERLCGQGFSKAQVLQEAGLAKKEDSTKWLSQYALNPEWVKSGKSLPRLNKTPRQYVAILEAAAKLFGGDPDQMLLEVFGSTSLAEGGKLRTAAPGYEELARRLRNIAGAVATSRDLQTYFQRVVRSGNQLLVTNEADETPWNKLAPSDIALGFCKNRIDLGWPISFRSRTDDARFHDHDQSVPPYPAVLLGEWFVGEVNLSTIFGWDTTDDPHHRKDGKCLFGGGMLCHYKAELRLCIVPVGPDMHPEPALRVKVGVWFPGITIEDETGINHTLIFEGLDWIPSSEPGPIRARVSSNGFLMNCRLWSDGHAAPPLITQYFPQGRGSHTCQFLPLTGRVAEDWFSLPAYDFELQEWHHSNVPIHIRAVGAPLFRNICADDFSPFKANTIAAGLDHILSGHHEHDLLALLDTRASQFVRLLDDASATARAQRDKAMADLDARLRRMRDEVP